MRNFVKLTEGVDVKPLLLAIQRQPDLWNRHKVRKEAPNSPHGEMDDIWIRYNDETKFKESGDYSTFNNEHDSVWYPEYYCLPELKPLIFGLMNAVQGERLGGVLITRIPSGKEIKPHKDSGWHVDYYDKFYLSLQNSSGSKTYCEDESINPNQGDIWWFDNRKLHWVKNGSSEDKMTLIVCIKTHQFRGMNAT